MTTATLRLDDVTHRAFLGTRELIRVTTALADVGIIDTQWYTEDARDRGTALHRAIHAWAHQQPIPTFDAIRPFWNGFLSFLETTEFACSSSEHPIHDEFHGYAGQFDLLGRLPSLSADAIDLIDVKSGTAAPWVRLQTIGYGRCLGGRIRRWALELPGNESYRLLPLNVRADGRIDRIQDQQDEAVFLAAVRVARWKRGL